MRGDNRGKNWQRPPMPAAVPDAALSPQTSRPASGKRLAAPADASSSACCSAKPPDFQHVGVGGGKQGGKRGEGWQQSRRQQQHMSQRRARRLPTCEHGQQGRGAEGMREKRVADKRKWSGSIPACDCSGGFEASRHARSCVHQWKDACTCFRGAKTTEAF
eukprot:363973-Chlamydomonas_euryale.AAC.7